MRAGGFVIVRRTAVCCTPSTLTGEMRFARIGSRDARPARGDVVVKNVAASAARRAARTFSDAVALMQHRCGGSCQALGGIAL